MAVRTKSGDITFGVLLRDHRTAANLTQEELAGRSGLTSQAISLLERGARRTPRTSTVELLVRALSLDAPQRQALVAAARGRPCERGEPALVPRELPHPLADFTGRTAELAELGLGLALTAPGGDARPVVISAIDGMGGTGKSALAIQAAHQLVAAGCFPDGQLYVNLHGATSRLPPLEPIDALARMLRSLGVVPAAIPTQTDEAAAWFRTLTAGRRLLVVLDNARGSDQVRPLLPGGPTCAVMVTSRRMLGLEGARSLHLDVLLAEQGLELLARIAGRERIRAEPEAAAEVVRLGGRLPLAIRIAGARLAAHTRWPVAELLQHLAGAAHRPEAGLLGRPEPAASALLERRLVDAGLLEPSRPEL